MSGFTVEQLIRLKNELISSDSISSFLEKVDSQINDKKIILKNPDSFIKVKDLWFSLPSYEVLENNGIETVDDLHKVSISSLNGVDEIIKEELNWAKRTYDFSNIDCRLLTKKRK